MWRKIPVSFVMLVALACPAFAQRHVGGGETDPNKAAFLARLVGRSVIVRVYPQQGKDGVFTPVDIPLSDGVIRAGAIKEACPSVSGLSLILILGVDQNDSVVADSLGSSVCLKVYADGLSVSLLDLAKERENLDPWWVILDALGEPIRGATVATYVCYEYASVEIPLCRDTTDDQGRIRRRVSHESAAFHLEVEHPDYGIGKVQRWSRELERAGVYWISLAPRGSEAAATGIRGTVTDGEGHPLPGAVVCCNLLSPGDYPQSDFLDCTCWQSITDAKGRFALCIPRLTRSLEWKGLRAKGEQHWIKITPPKDSNLGSVFPHGSLCMYPGTLRTLILPPKDLQKFHHTFEFEYVEGSAVVQRNLERIELVFFRNGIEWWRLGYDFFTRGWDLPSGTLRAVVERWPGEVFQFQDIEITQDSPEHLVFKPMPAIRYRGHVVDEASGTPMPNVLVAAGPVSERWEGPSLIDELTQQFQAQKAGEPTDQGPPIVYKAFDRVTMSNADGLFEFTFMPGVAPSLGEFTAVVPGRPRVSIAAPPPVPDAIGILKLPAIEVPTPGDVDSPVNFVFEDETGPVTDAERLKDVMLEIHTPSGVVYSGGFEDLRKTLGAVAGTYCAQAVWNNLHYAFEPVDLDAEPPSPVVFRPASVGPADVTCTGRVVHGVTGEPIAGALVLYNRMPGGGDLSSLTPEQWAAVDALATASDVADPALVPLLSLLIPSGASVTETIPQVVRTDAGGRFSLRWRYEPNARRADCLLAFAKDFLGARQQLTFLASADSDPATVPELRRLEPDSNGAISIQPMRLFPAGTVIIEPILPNVLSENGRQRVGLTWTTWWEPVPSDWIEDVAIMPRHNNGASVYLPPSIPANIRQSIHLPADAAVCLLLSMQSPDGLPSIRYPIRLEQGQRMDLGTLEFLPSVAILITLRDSRENPLVGMRVEYNNQDSVRAGGVTDATGTMRATVPAYWSTCFDIMSGDTRSGVSFDCSVRGREDVGLRFIVEIPDSMLESIRERSDD